MNAGALKLVGESLTDLVSANASEESALARVCVLEHVVGSANRVEGRATWNSHLVGSGPNFAEERLMLFISKTSLTVLKPILV